MADYVVTYKDGRTDTVTLSPYAELTAERQYRSLKDNQQWLEFVYRQIWLTVDKTADFDAFIETLREIKVAEGEVEPVPTTPGLPSGDSSESAS